MSERGGFPVAFLIVVVGMLVVFGLALDACFDDEDETNDLGHRVELVGRYYDDDHEDDGNGGRDCQDAGEGCSDDDLSPRFDESPITIIICPQRCV